MSKVHYEIIKRTPRREVIGVNMGGKDGQVKFDTTTARITDKALADDIRTSIGQDGGKGRNCDVLVAEVPDRSRKITSQGFGPGKWDEIREEQKKEGKK